eukprot:Nitzschia sp. Nitz4//scaffold203_size38902//24600//25796//NITZ4_007662-RA/size38902-snap-gene-0.54-mRNA-1//1//CDS//3329541430//6974//frame0
MEDGRWNVPDVEQLKDSGTPLPPSPNIFGNHKPTERMHIHNLTVGKPIHIPTSKTYSVALFEIILDHNSIMPSVTSSSPIVNNFRQAAGLVNVFRCASTDSLGDCCSDLVPGTTRASTILDLSPTNLFLLYQAGLFLDLRTAKERNDDRAKAWTSAMGVPMLPASTYPSSLPLRCVVQIDVLPKKKFLSYIETEWFNEEHRRIQDMSIRRSLRWQYLQQRGLAGLNQAILEVEPSAIRSALCHLTTYLEMYPTSTVVIHCVQGKDRTGMLVMLLQSLCGVSDETIIEDYVKSGEMLAMAHARNGSAAMQVAGRSSGESTKVNADLYSGTFRKDMITTMAYIRNKYGSIAPGYFDAIGLDREWQQRLVNALRPTTTSPTAPKISSRM